MAGLRRQVQESDVSLTSILLSTRFTLPFRTFDPVTDWTPPPLETLNRLRSQVISVTRVLQSPVFLSVNGDGGPSQAVSLY